VRRAGRKEGKGQTEREREGRRAFASHIGFAEVSGGAGGDILLTAACAEESASSSSAREDAAPAMAAAEGGGERREEIRSSHDSEISLPTSFGES